MGKSTAPASYRAVAGPGEYGAVDCFRPVAALLVVGIHTYPFLLFGEGVNFGFSLVFSRVAVPFFLLVTGYFVLPQCLQKGKSACAVPTPRPGAS